MVVVVVWFSGCMGLVVGVRFCWCTRSLAVLLVNVNVNLSCVYYLCCGRRKENLQICPLALVDLALLLAINTRPL